LTLTFTTDLSDVATILSHLVVCDPTFNPRLSERVDLEAYARKLVTHATRHEAWEGDRLLGLVAIYANAPDRMTAFITNVSVTPDQQGKGLAARLLAAGIESVRDLGFGRISLQVGQGNARAHSLYIRQGFKPVAWRDEMIEMILILKENV
jgi:ribosomal-protein-alanine N-acetyltransferase